MIYPLLPLFLTQVLGAGVLFVGLIEGMAESVSSFLKLFSGWFSDRFQRRKSLILFGYSLASINRPFVGLATSPFHVLLLRFLDRVGKGVRTSPRDALLSQYCQGEERAWVADLVEESKRGTAYGAYHFFIGMATLPASFLMGLIWQTAGVVWAFSLGAGMALIAALLAMGLMRNQQAAAPPLTQHS